MRDDKTVAEFFAGIGLMRMGLEQAGWDVVWANDIDEDKFRMYRGHFVQDSADFVVQDVHSVNPDSIPDVSLATASFPCNDLSLAGSRHGLGGKHSSAFWGFINSLKGMRNRRPSLVMLENVPGFLTSRKGEDFKEACIALNRLGYSVDAFIIDASLFVPQSRQRLFIIGSLQERLKQVSGRVSFYESQLRPSALADFIFLHPEIRWSIRPVPDITKTTPTLSDVLEKLPNSSPFWWSQERAQYLLNQMSVKHRAVADQMIAGKTISCGTVFRRIRNNRSMAELRTDDIAGCLRTPRGGSGRQILFLAGKGAYRARLLTPRECARLMGANEYKITVPLNKALFGFGDAVCVPVVRWIAEHYLTPLWKELQDSEITKGVYTAKAV